MCSLATRVDFLSGSSLVLESSSGPPTGESGWVPLLFSLGRRSSLFDSPVSRHLATRSYKVITFDRVAPAGCPHLRLNRFCYRKPTILPFPAKVRLHRLVNPSPHIGNWKLLWAIRQREWSAVFEEACFHPTGALLFPPGGPTKIEEFFCLLQEGQQNWGIFLSPPRGSTIIDEILVSSKRVNKIEEFFVSSKRVNNNWGNFCLLQEGQQSHREQCHFPYSIFSVNWLQILLSVGWNNLDLLLNWCWLLGKCC